jgi:hypothetical protein
MMPQQNPSNKSLLALLPLFEFRRLHHSLRCFAAFVQSFSNFLHGENSSALTIKCRTVAKLYLLLGHDDQD